MNRQNEVSQELLSGLRGAHLLHGTVSDKVGEVEGVGAGTPGETTNTNTGEPAKKKCVSTHCNLIYCSITSFSNPIQKCFLHSKYFSHLLAAILLGAQRLILANSASGLSSHSLNCQILCSVSI